VIAGLACALVASAIYGLASVVQAVGSRRAGAVGSADVRAIARLLAQTLYLAGLGMDGAGFLLSLVAFRSLPLFAVEAILAASVGITAVAAARLLHARLDARDRWALAALLSGLVLLAISARAEHTPAVGQSARWALLVAALAVAALAALELRAAPSRASSVRLACLAGLAFGGVGIATRVIRLPDPWWHVVGSPALYALALSGAAGTIAYAVGLQRGSVTAVASVTFALETVVPAVVGLLWLGDGARSGFAPVAAAGFAVTVLASIALSRHAEVPDEIPDAEQA
jgi:drug/metabolite transporter (DMT)-like permease